MILVHYVPLSPFTDQAVALIDDHVQAQPADHADEELDDVADDVLQDLRLRDLKIIPSKNLDTRKLHRSQANQLKID